MPCHHKENIFSAFSILGKRWIFVGFLFSAEWEEKETNNNNNKIVIRSESQKNWFFRSGRLRLSASLGSGDANCGSTPYDFVRWNAMANIRCIPCLIVSLFYLWVIIYGRGFGCVFFLFLAARFVWPLRCFLAHNHTQHTHIYDRGLKTSHNAPSIGIAQFGHLRHVRRTY